MSLSVEQATLILMLKAASMNQSGRMLLKSLVTSYIVQGNHSSNLFFKAHFRSDGRLEKLTQKKIEPNFDCNVISILDPTLVMFQPFKGCAIADVIEFKKSCLSTFLESIGLDVGWLENKMVLKRENSPLLQMNSEGELSSHNPEVLEILNVRDDLEES